MTKTTQQKKGSEMTKTTQQKKCLSVGIKKNENLLLLEMKAEMNLKEYKWYNFILANLDNNGELVLSVKENYEALSLNRVEAYRDIYKTTASIQDKSTWRRKEFNEENGRWVLESYVILNRCEYEDGKIYVKANSSPKVKELLKIESGNFYMIPAGVKFNSVKTFKLMEFFKKQVYQPAHPYAFRERKNFKVDTLQLRKILSVGETTRNNTFFSSLKKMVCEINGEPNTFLNIALLKNNKDYLIFDVKHFKNEYQKTSFENSKALIVKEEERIRALTNDPNYKPLEKQIIKAYDYDTGEEKWSKIQTKKPPKTPQNQTNNNFSRKHTADTPNDPKNNPTGQIFGNFSDSHLTKKTKPKKTKKFNDIMGTSVENNLNKFENTAAIDLAFHDGQIDIWTAQEEYKKKGK